MPGSTSRTRGARCEAFLDTDHHQLACKMRLGPVESVGMRRAHQVDNRRRKPVGKLAAAPLGDRRILRLAADVPPLASLRWRPCRSSMGFDGSEAHEPSRPAKIAMSCNISPMGSSTVAKPRKAPLTSGRQAMSVIVRGRDPVGSSPRVARVLASGASVGRLIVVSGRASSADPRSSASAAPASAPGAACLRTGHHCEAARVASARGSRVPAPSFAAACSRASSRR